MVKRCAYGVCNNDDRYRDRVVGVSFHPFPKPKTNLEKCLRWIKLCNRPHDQLNVNTITRNVYVCSKHFVGGQGPSALYPDPLPHSNDTPRPSIQLPKKRKLDFSPKRTTLSEINETQKENVCIASGNTISSSCQTDASDTTQSTLCQTDSSSQVSFDPDPDEDVQLQLVSLDYVSVTTDRCYASAPNIKVQYVTKPDIDAVYDIVDTDLTVPITGNSCGENKRQYRIRLYRLYFVANPDLVGGSFNLKATVNNDERNSTLSRRTYTFPAPFNLTGSSLNGVFNVSFTWTCHVTSDYPIIEWVLGDITIRQAGVVSNGDCVIFGQNDSYLYDCQQSALTYTLTIPSASIGLNLQASIWRCKDVYSELRGSKFMELDIVVPVTTVSLSPRDGSTHKVNENQTITFTCLTNNAVPPPTILWYFGSSDVTSQAGYNRTTLTVIVSRINHQQSVSCVAWNTGNAANLSDSTRLNVRFPPANNEELQIVGYTSGQVLYENNPAMINISCTQPGGNPVVNMTFTCGSRTGTNANTAAEAIRRISLTNDRNLNGQRCSCVSTHINGYVRSIDVNFVVYYPPSTPTSSISSSFPWKASGTYSLTCNTYPGNPPATTYIWNERGSDLRITSQKYELNPLHPSDDGRQLYCQVNNNFTVQNNVVLTSNATILQVEYDPVVFLPQSTVKVIEGYVAVLRCSSTGNPAPSVTWYRGSTQVTGNTISSSNYSIVNSNRTSTGNYTCVARSSSTGSNVLQPDQQMLYLRVFYPPKVSLYLQNTTENIQNNVIRCTAVGDPDNSTIVALQQMIGSTFIRNITHFTDSSSGNLTLNIPRVSYQDQGTYRCLATNGIPDRSNQKIQSDTAYFDVKTAAKFEMTQYTVRADLDTPIAISIPFYRNPPGSERDLVWINNTGSSNDTLVSSEKISISLKETDVQQTIHGVDVTLRGQSAVLTISSFQSYYEGNYTLRITSDHSNSETVKVSLIRAMRPNPPTNLTVQCKERVATLSWTHSNNNGVDVRFQILYKEEDVGAFNFLEKEYADVEQSHTLFAYIENIQPKRIYNFKVAARNNHGLSDYSETRNCVVFDDNSPGSSTAGVAGGITSGFLVIIAILIAVIVILFRKYRNGKGQGTKKESDSIDQYEDIQTPNKNNTQGEESRQSQGQSSPYEELQNNRDQHTYDHIGNRTPYENLEMC